MPLPPSRELELGGAVRRQLDQLVIEEGRPRLQSPRHRHVVHALDGVVDEHHLAVDPQRAIQRRGGARGREVALHELARGIAGEPQAGMHHRAALGVRAVHELGDVLAGAAPGAAASGGYQEYPAKISSAPWPDCTTLTWRETSWLRR